jgi:hypothetical protein
MPSWNSEYPPREHDDPDESTVENHIIPDVSHLTPDEFVTLCQTWLDHNTSKLDAINDQKAYFSLIAQDKAITVTSTYTSTHLEIVWDG